ncbi:MAG: riboflavin kinase, partial [Cytophagales bacterium]
LYIGNRPTVNGTKRVIEVNLFNFNKIIYGENLTVYFHALIRLDSKFNDLEALKQQLHNDKFKALAALENTRL